jgi:hypothetical protein
VSIKFIIGRIGMATAIMMMVLGWRSLAKWDRSAEHSKRKSGLGRI